jgi:hypothetical protein
VRSGDNAPLSSGFIRVIGDCFTSVEVQVALDRKAEGAAKLANFSRADESELLAPIRRRSPYGPA